MGASHGIGYRQEQQSTAGADPGFGKGGFCRYKNAREARAKF